MHVNLVLCILIITQKIGEGREVVGLVQVKGHFFKVFHWIKQKLLVGFARFSNFQWLSFIRFPGTDSERKRAAASSLFFSIWVTCVCSWSLPAQPGLCRKALDLLSKLLNPQELQLRVFSLKQFLHSRDSSIDVPGSNGKPSLFLPFDSYSEHAHQRDRVREHRQCPWSRYWRRKLRC